MAAQEEIPDLERENVISEEFEDFVLGEFTAEVSEISTDEKGLELLKGCKNTFYLSGAFEEITAILIRSIGKFKMIDIIFGKRYTSLNGLVQLDPDDKKQLYDFIRKSIISGRVFTSSAKIGNYTIIAPTEIYCTSEVDLKNILKSLTETLKSL